jgi:hypothetical protein
MTLRIKIAAKVIEELNQRNECSDTKKKYTTCKSKIRRVLIEKNGKTE